MSNDAAVPIKSQLTDARAATDFVSGLLHGRSDADLAGSSLLPGWTRAHVIVHLAQNALAIDRLCVSIDRSRDADV
jgi:maleylpyruvate isomerase